MEKTLKVGIMPGKLNEVAYEGGISVRGLFELAEVEVGEGYELKLDNRTVGMDDIVTEGNLLIAVKKIKGNSSIKVGIMPGKLTEVAYENEIEVRDLFELAEVEVGEGYELKLDNKTVYMDDVVTEGNLLIAVKKIKGNK